LGWQRLVFWTLFLSGAVFACFSYIPLTELSQKLFVEATGRQQTWFFPQRMNNGVMLWALANGILGFALFFVGLKIQGKSFSWDNLGLDVNPGELRRALLLAVLIFFFFFGLLFVVYSLFHVDYRFLFLGVISSNRRFFFSCSSTPPSFSFFFYRTPSGPIFHYVLLTLLLGAACSSPV
jgi:hypothetical protein